MMRSFHVSLRSKCRLNHFELANAAVDLYEPGAEILWADVSKGGECTFIRMNLTIKFIAADKFCIEFY